MPAFLQVGSFGLKCPPRHRHSNLGTDVDVLCIIVRYTGFRHRHAWFVSLTVKLEETAVIGSRAADSWAVMRLTLI